MYLDVLSRFPETTPKPTPLLFVHGSFADARCWEEHFLPYFAQQGYAAHAISLRGHGRSEGHKQILIWRLADYVADIKKTAEQLPNPPVIIGHSMGGMVVQKYLEQQPKVAGAVLMASVPPQGLLPVNLYMAMRHPFLFQQMALLSLLGPSVGTPEMMERLLFFSDMPRAKLDHYFQYMQAESQVVALDMMGLNPLRLKPAQLRIPVLVLGAQNDVLISSTTIAETARFYQADAHIFPKMGHAMMMELNWREVADALLAWLEQTVLPQVKTS